MIDRLELLPNVLCPECGGHLAASPTRMAIKASQSTIHRDDKVWERTYIVDCGNMGCKDYRKVKFLPARYVEVESHEL